MVSEVTRLKLEKLSQLIAPSQRQAFLEAELRRAEEFEAKLEAEKTHEPTATDAA